MKPFEGLLFFIFMLGMGMLTHFMPFYVMAAAALIVTVAHAVREDKEREDDQGL